MFFGGNSTPSRKTKLLGNVNNIITRREKQTLSANDSRINTTTFNQLIQCPYPSFQRVRLLYGNIESSGTFTVKSIVGVASDFGVGGTSSSKKWTTDSNNASITNDGVTGWQAVLQSGAATGTVPAKGADTSLPGLLFSDWVDQQSVTPTNGATYPVLIARTIVTASGGTGFTNLNHGTDTLTKTFDTGIYRETYISTGDFVSSNTAVFSGGSNQGVGPVIGVEFMVDGIITRFLCVGDSITQGIDTGNTLDHYSWVQKAQELLTASGVPANLINCGFSGATTAQISAFGKKAIDAHLPNGIFYPPFSPNDGTPTQTLIDTQYRRAIDFSNYALSKNVLPIFVFLAPKDYSSADDAFRKQLITRCKASGIAVCDMSTATGDGATPERYKSGLNSDATHPNAAGYTAMAPVAVSTILDIISHNLVY